MKSCPPGPSMRLNVGSFYKQTVQQTVQPFPLCISCPAPERYGTQMKVIASGVLPPAQVFLVVVSNGKGRTASSSRSTRSVR